LPKIEKGPTPPPPPPAGWKRKAREVGEDDGIPTAPPPPAKRKATVKRRTEVPAQADLLSAIREHKGVEDLSSRGKEAVSRLKKEVNDVRGQVESAAEDIGINKGDLVSILAGAMASRRGDISGEAQKEVEGAEEAEWDNP